MLSNFELSEFIVSIKLYLKWVAATAIGLTIAGIVSQVSMMAGIFHYHPSTPILILELIIGVALAFFAGFALGGSQYLVLRSKIENAKKWIWVTASVWGIFISPLGILIALAYWELIDINLDFVGVQNIHYYFLFLLAAVLSIAQWLVLRIEVKKAYWWIVASIIGWSSFIFFLFENQIDSIRQITDLIASVAFPALITGLAIVFLFDRSRQRWLNLGINVLLCIISIVSLFFVTSAKTSPHQIFQGHSDTVTTVDFSPDGEMVASGSLDGTIRIWDVADGKEIIVLQNKPKKVYDLSFSPDGQSLISRYGYYCESQIIIWEISSGEIIHQINPISDEECPPQFEDNVELSPDGNSVTVPINYYGDIGKEISILDSVSGEVIEVIPLENVIGCIAYSPDGKLLASATYENEKPIKFWELDGEKEVDFLDFSTLEPGKQFEKDPTRGYDFTDVCIDFSDDGKYIAAGHYRFGYGIWNLDTGELTHILQKKHEFSYKYPAIFSPNSKYIAGLSSKENKIVIWDTSTGKKVQTLSGHLDFVRDFAFSPNGRQLVSGSDDKTVRIWDISSLP